MSLVRFALRWWAAFAMVAALSFLGVAHLFEHFGYAPCHLCLKQREVYWVAAALGALSVVVALATRTSGTARLAAFLLFALFAAEAILALFHAGVELKWWHGPATCTGAGVVDMSAVTKMLEGLTRPKPVMCDVAAWTFGGVSMAGYNAMAAAVLAVISLFAAARTPEPSRG
jgi:disulfide bond formation protein DsbB